MLPDEYSSCQGIFEVIEGKGDGREEASARQPHPCEKQNRKGRPPIGVLTDRGAATRQTQPSKFGDL